MSKTIEIKYVNLNDESSPTPVSKETKGEAQNSPLMQATSLLCKDCAKKQFSKCKNECIYKTGELLEMVIAARETKEKLVLKLDNAKKTYFKRLIYYCTGKGKKYQHKIDQNGIII